MSSPSPPSTPASPVPGPGETKTVQYKTPFTLTGTNVEVKGYKYTTFGPSDFLNFRNLCEDMSPDWKSELDGKEGVYVWTREIKDLPIKICRVFGLLPEVPPELAWHVLQDPEFRKEWDENRKEAYRFCKLDATTDIGYYAAKLPGPCDDREFVNQRGWMNCGNGEYIIFNTSVPHADLPKHKKGRVRALSYVSGFFIRPFENGCSLTYLTQVDPMGNIPGFVANAVATKVGPDIGKKLTAASAKYLDWLKASGDKHRDWVDCPVSSWPEEQKNLLHDMHAEQVAKREAKKAAKAKK